MYKNKSLKKYTDDLAARLPAPGGGSAAALSGALGCALISMVCNFTIGKEKYKIFQADIKKILKISEKLRKNLLTLVDLDVAAYKSKNINKSLAVPLRVAEDCLKAMRLCPALVKKSNRYLITDVSCAVVLLEAGWSSAYANVLINLKYLKDRKKRDRILTIFNPAKKEVNSIRKRVEKDVCKIIGR
ncbi:MAG: cyclodeaminase/cyclohydrolase family protein [Candidatus Omnitrophica bacterium]|nr:cyclodeaminase/cyclohydrolase family protein [Candidatus Omnitrophota bacterium]MDD5237175.1 cyclodeaminase/cyclohydrolase family protein [Candidatus Omnitrophota bacterium]MDD5610884.1 cyclodeaminase/cyclohydrolase family protein [Candidatus Omnitrophota bacterium]